MTVTSPLVSFLRNSRRSSSTLAAIVAVYLSLYGTCALPVDQFKLQLGTLSGQDWRAEGVQLNIRWSDGRSGSFTLSAERLTHAALPFPLLSPGIHCEQGVVDDHLISCEQGHLKVASPVLDNDRFPVEFKWQRAERKFALSIEQLGLAGGSVKLRVDAEAAHWKLKVNGQKLAIQRLRKSLSTLGLALPQFKLAGRTNVELSLGGAVAVQSAEWKLKFGEVAFSDSQGSFIGESLAGEWKGNLRASGRGYSGSTRLALERGALLTPFAYLEPEVDVISVGMNFHLDNTFSNLVVKQLEYRDPEVIALSAEGSVALTSDPRVEYLKIRSQPVELDRVYRKYFQPVLSDEFFETLSLHGGARFEFEQESVSTLKLELSDLTIRQGGADDSGGENFRVSGLEGNLIWSSDDSVPQSTLLWRDGEFLQSIKIGAGQTLLKLSGGGVKLDAPLSLPLLDGALQVERFSIKQTASGPRVDFQGYITPISMKLISEALGWPPLAGQLSAMIPGISYEGGLLKLLGMTLVRAFDGTILLKNLQLDDLFGPLPVLHADVELKALDLETLTSTFSFGKITGRLAGRVNGLRLEQWQPVAFEARFATPENDPGSHRISQKAVDNISNLGGVGISGALSRSFLRFFEEFGYEKLGISCRLEKGVCEMGGIESADQGYYLVKGGGLPRIDIVGFNRKTDWSVLLERLKQVAEGGTPIIQ